jgi:hypothetical protein
MAKARSMPAADSARTISSRAPSSAKVGESGRTGAPAFSGCEVSVSGTPASLCSRMTGSILSSMVSMVSAIASLVF